MEINKLFKENADYRPFDTQDADEVYMSEEKFTEVVNALFAKRIVIPTLLCVDGKVDGLKEGEKYGIINEGKEHYFLTDEYGQRNWFKKNRFKVIEAQ